MQIPVSSVIKERIVSPLRSISKVNVMKMGMKYVEGEMDIEDIKFIAYLNIKRHYSESVT